ncbi:MAG TPA: hypothetical protein VG408_06420, partial [Actinomycetota bacterium]|nr:hypothetical protein [Actinomycetota bacterium]
MEKGRNHPLAFYMGAVMVAGLSVAAFHAFSFGFPTGVKQLELLLLLGAFTIAGELLPIVIKRRDQESAITVSTTFSFALLLILGPLAAA